MANINLHNVSKQEEALYKVIDTGYPLDGDIPTVPTEVAPDGRPIYNMTGRRTYKAGLYNDCCGEREVISATLNKSYLYVSQSSL